MVFSEIEYSDVIQYLHIDSDDVTTAEQTLITGYLEAAKTYIKGYTGLDDDEVDEHPELAVALLCLAGDMYTNRDMTTPKTATSTNRTVESILNMHCTNLVPVEEE